MDTDLANMDNPIYKRVVAYGTPVKAMHTAVALLNSGAGANFIHSALISPEWRNNVKKESLPKLQSATRQPPQTRDLVMLHLRLREVFSRVWFGIAPKFAIKLLPGPAFIDRFICNIFPSKRKIVTWYSSPVAIHSNPEPGYSVKSAQGAQENPENKEERS